MISFESTGSFRNTEKFLQNMKSRSIYKVLDSQGKAGVAALSAATPTRSGRTANSWYYEISITDTSVELQWKNRNVNGGAVIALLIEYGHGTGTGGYVSGRNYINGAIKPVFDRAADAVWREVTSA